MAQQNLGIYDPANVFVTIGFRDIEAFAEDEMVRTERLDENEASARVGAQGDYTFQINQNKAGMFILTLKQLSPSNPYLQSLKEAKSIFPVAIRSTHNYLELATASQAMIGIAPRKTMGKEESDREWQIVCGELIETDKAI